MKQELDIILGLGKTGYSVVKHLHSHNPLAVCDSRLGRNTQAIPYLNNMRTEFPDVCVIPPKHFKRALCAANRVIASPGIPLSDHLLKWASIERVPIVSDMDLFMETITVPVAAITGTNGKSTTVSLVAEMLKDRGYQACGNLGLPVLQALHADAQGFVVELSSFQLERMQLCRFRVASILNISEDHLDHHESKEQYIEAKHNIYRKCDIAIYDHLDPLTKPSRDIPTLALNRDDQWMVTTDGVHVDGHFIHKNEIALSGTHNLRNLLHASAIALCLGASLDEVCRVANSFKSLPHRSNLVDSVEGVNYIDDSKATNPHAAIAAIKSQANSGANLIVISGGSDKGADFSEFGECIDRHAAVLIVLGQDCEIITDTVNKTQWHRAVNMSEAVVLAHSVASAGDTVLLAPACASFDLYKDYTERGTAFEDSIQDLRK